MFSVRGILAVLITAAVLAVPLYFYREYLTRGMRPSPSTLRLNELERDGMPAFSMPDLKGRPIALDSFKGKTVILNLWASWCAPCVKEFPSLKVLAQTYPEDLVIFAVSHDNTREDLESFIAAFGAVPPNFVIVWDKERFTGKLLGTDALPESYILKRDQRLFRKVVGEQVWDTPDALQFFKDVIKL